MTPHDTPEAAWEAFFAERNAELIEMTGRPHPHDEGRPCGTCEAYRLLTRSPLLCLPEDPTEDDRVATYRAALAHGLSDAEAREEGWPQHG